MSETKLEHVVGSDVVPMFAGGSLYTVSIEEELLLVDPVTHALNPAFPAALAAAVFSHEGALVGEVSAAEIELVSPVCAGIRDAVSAVRALPQRQRDLHARAGMAGLLGDLTTRTMHGGAPDGG